MVKQRLALLNFYFKVEDDSNEFLIDFFENAGIDLEQLNQKKAKLLKKIEAFEKIKQGELFAEKVKTVFQKIQNNIIDISSLQLSNDSQNDLQLSYNKFSGSQEDLLQDKIKEKTKLEIIQKIKNGEL